MTGHEMLDLNIDIVKGFLEQDFETIQQLLKEVEVETYVALASLTASFVASFSTEPIKELENARTQLHAAID